MLDTPSCADGVLLDTIQCVGHSQITTALALVRAGDLPALLEKYKQVRCTLDGCVGYMLGTQ